MGPHKIDEIGCIEELKAFFEILVIICVEKHFSMKAFKASLFRDFKERWEVVLCIGKDSPAPLGFRRIVLLTNQY